MKSAFASAKVAGIQLTGIQFAAILLALGFHSAVLTAQQPTGDPDPSAIPVTVPLNAPQTGGPALSVRSDDILKSFEPAANEEYTLGAGDVISLDFPGHPDLTAAAKQTIGPDGRITLPVAGSVHIAGLSRGDAQAAIVKAMSDFYTDLNVTVRIESYASNHVRVLGYVQKPGEILFEGTPTLLGAISRAGMIAPTATTKENVVTNVGNGIPELCTIYRGNSDAIQVHLRSLLMSGNSLADMRLRRDDIIYVPEPKQAFVSVLGQVTKPGTIPLTADSTLTSILAQAGCCTEIGGFNPKIHIVQVATGNDIVVEYKKLMTLQGQKEYTLHSGDVIVIPISGFNKVAGIVTKISGVATMVSLAAIVGAG